MEKVSSGQHTEKLIKEKLPWRKFTLSYYPDSFRLHHLDLSQLYIFSL